MGAVVNWVLETQNTLATTPVHSKYLPFAWLDVLGAIRLSVFIDQFSRQRNGVKPNEQGSGKRGTWLQECCGMLTLIFGGETLLCSCLGLTPSWMQSPSIVFLFCGIHYILTRTPCHRIIPRKPSIWLEFPLSLFDALGRAIILTTFSVDFIRKNLALPPTIRSNPWLMVLAAFINTVPFASLAFACHMFDKEWKFGTPGEVQPGGWMMVDAWAPPVIAAVYATLVRAHPVFDMPYQAIRLALLRRPVFVHLIGFETFKTILPSTPTALDPLKARAICAIILAGLFALRAFYNFGGDLSKLPRIPHRHKTYIPEVASNEKAEASSPPKNKKKKKAKHGFNISQEL